MPFWRPLMPPKRFFHDILWSLKVQEWVLGLQKLACNCDVEEDAHMGIISQPKLVSQVFEHNLIWKYTLYLKVLPFAQQYFCN